MTSKELKNKPVAITSLDEDNSTVNFVFGYIAGTSSKRVKEEFLNQHMSPLIEQILKDTYGGRKYYIKKYEINGSGPFTIDTDYAYFHSVLDDLANRKYTGQVAIDYLVNCIEQFCERDQVWLARILDGNLKIGAGNTFSKDAGVIEKMPVALANVLEKCKTADPLDGNWFVSRKLDGVRTLAFVDSHDGQVDVTFRSRQGRTFTTLDNLREAFQQLFRIMPGKWVVDGETCIINDKGEEDFRGLMTMVTRKDFTIQYPMFNAFDLLTEDEFWGRAESPCFADRYKALCSLYNNATNGGMFGQDIDRCFAVLVQEHVDCQEILDMWLEKRKQGGWEGLMIRKNVPYEGKRTNNLLKIKPMRDNEYVITGIIEGDMTYNTTTGSETIHGVSAITFQHKGNEVKCGSGLTKEQRLRWVEHPEEIVGKTVTIQYFEETQDRKTGLFSLRFPTLKFVYENGRDC